MYINNIYNNFNRPFLSELKNRKHKCPFVPLSLCPIVPPFDFVELSRLGRTQASSDSALAAPSFDFVEFLLARHSSNKFGSALASFVILTFEINRTIIAGNYCFASEIFVLLHCQRKKTKFAA